MLLSIQLLRGLAALLVVLHHIAFKEKVYGVNGLEWLHIGASGVDLFFIISGFIMCYATHNKEMSFSKFIFLRFERIIPLYWLFTTLALFVFIMYPHLVNSSGGHTSVINSYFLIPTSDKYLVQNGWTLSYEFYYYIIFSFFIFLTKNRFVRYLGIVLTLFGLATIGQLFVAHNTLIKFIFSDWLYEFAMGVVSFYLFAKYKLEKKTGLILICVGVVLLGYKNNHMYLLSSMPGALSVGLPMWLIFHGFLALEEWLGKGNNIYLKVGVLLGYSSYSLYLVHPFILSPVAMILKKIHLNIPYVFSVGLLVPAIISGAIVYLYIEKPMVNYLKLIRVGRGFNGKIS
ncbi:acyltransferase family protein [Scandinavium lactucae]|uniref:Acyltransferase n=1 Tax=Scandinavium lactucae TaxID=3095028 RepID=A0ABU4QNK0_9ENTR|nr:MULTISPECIES: acyltransferase [unclassified Scandinavium]MDX6040417.1 acyltransferase [Scandinavium sp. V105_6]MDX6050912.1 acyltransferase [Scandinavium sp. V105_1]